jgi:hypothetical protein
VRLRACAPPVQHEEVELADYVLVHARVGLAAQGLEIRQVRVQALGVIAKAPPILRAVRELTAAARVEGAAARGPGEVWA